MEEELATLLLAKANRGVFNKSELNWELCLEAVCEALELGGDVGQTLILDLALIRLKLNLKVPLNEYEEKTQLYIIKKGEVQKGVKENSLYASGVRSSEWDM